MSSGTKAILDSQRDFFHRGETKDYKFRLEQLKILKLAIQQNEALILEALNKDLKKPKFEAYFSEPLIIIEEINYAIKHLKRWMIDKKCKGSILHFPSKARIQSEPLGLVLIIAPWNFPFLCQLSPLVGAIAAGNCAALKPSELTPECSKVINKIISENFPQSYISVFEGGAEVSQDLLKERFDHIFFTGGTTVGKIIMQAATENLTPVTLELGGKSPCIVTESSNIKEVAKRLCWGKFFNAGQCCVAPDYLLIQQSIKNDFIHEIKKQIKLAYGEDIQASPDFPRIVNRRHFDRLVKLIEHEKIIFGGRAIGDDLFIEPTILDTEIDLDQNNNDFNKAILQEEIFGPIMPLVTYKKLNQAIDYVNCNEKPLALYVFSQDPRQIGRVTHETSSGGVSINDTMIHTGSPELPFGGVGNSGIGKYHGKYSFDLFSNHKAIVERSQIFDMPIKYAPYGDKFEKFKKLFS